MLPTRPSSTSRTFHEDPLLKALVPGSWWRVAQGDDLEKDIEVPEHGLVLLVEKVHIIDDEIHSVEVRAHPKQFSSHYTFLREDFLTRFTFEPEGAVLRQREQAEIMAEMQRLPERLAAAQRIEIEHTSSEMSEKFKTLPAVLQGQGTRVDDAQNALTLAQKRQDAVTALTKGMDQNAKLLAKFQREQVAAMTASISKDVEMAQSTLSKLHTLTLFLGEHQTVTPLLDGASAPQDEKLHFFQRLLFLDEEFAIHFLNKDFDWRQLNNLTALFEEHPDMVTRLLPQPRSVVIARVRRNPKPLPQSAGIDAFFAHIKEAALDEALVILIRDGERVVMVEADQDTANAERLFPSRKEIDDLYKTWSHKTITPADLEYSKSRDKHARRGLFYKRFLVLFWGLHARENLFGPFMDTESNWLDPQVQNENFVFVHDEELGLNAPGPSVQEWLDGQLDQIGVKSRVLIDTSHAVSIDSCEVAFDSTRNYDRPIRRLDPMKRIEEYVVEGENGDLFVRIMMEQPWSKSKPKRQKVYLKKGFEKTVYEGVLDLTHTRHEDLQHFLNSRRDRAYYLTTLNLLSEADRILAQEAPQEAKLQAEAKCTAHTLRLARAATKWAEMTPKVEKRLITLAKKMEKARASHQDGLLTPQGHKSLSAWSHPGVTLSTALFVSDIHTVTPTWPLDADTALLAPLPNVKASQTLSTPHVRPFLESVFTTPIDPFLGGQAAAENACQELMDATYKSSKRFVIRHDLCAIIGIADMPGFNSSQERTYALTLAIDPFLLLAQYDKEKAGKLIKGLYATPDHHLETLDTKTPWTLHGREITPRTPFAYTPGLDWDSVWTRDLDLSGKSGPRDAILGGKRLLMSRQHSTSFSIFANTDPNETAVEKIKNWHAAGCINVRQDAWEWMTTLDGFDFSDQDVTFV